MRTENHKLRTSMLWDILFKAPSAENYLDEYSEEMMPVPFHLYISALCKSQGEVPDRVIRRADIEKSFGHSLFRGGRRPSRDTVLQLAFGFRADIELTQELLKHAGHSQLYPRVCRDVVISYCLIRKMRFFEAQDLLLEKNLPLIGGEKK